MDKKKAICEYLRKNHIGKGNAIHSKKLEKLFMLDGRNIRRKISSLRQDGFPICSDESGYYYADNQKEINNTVYLNSFPAWTQISCGGGMSNPCVVYASYAQLSEWEYDENGEPDTCLRIIGFKAVDAEPVNM